MWACCVGVLWPTGKLFKDVGGNDEGRSLFFPPLRPSPQSTYYSVLQLPKMLSHRTCGKAGELVALGAALAFTIYTLTPEKDRISFEKLLAHIPLSDSVHRLKTNLQGRPLFRWIKRKFTTYDVYDPVEEENYWKSALSGQRKLQASDAKYVGKSLRNSYIPPLVMYYTPALPPAYRDNHRMRLPSPSDYHLSPHTICKWQRMMYPTHHRLRLSEASKLRRRLTPRDAKGIRRITKKEPNENVFSDANLTQRYQRSRGYRHMWHEWQIEPHEPELVIVFE